MSIFKRTQRKYVKKAYRVRNWREYEAGLRNRGSLTVWISLTAGKLVNWDAPRPRRRKPGRQRKYSNHAIETAVTLGMVFHLSSRQSEGLLRSLFALMKLDNDVLDHTTISRRKAKLGKVPFYQDKQKTPLLVSLRIYADCRQRVVLAEANPVQVHDRDLQLVQRTLHQPLQLLRACFHELTAHLALANPYRLRHLGKNRRVLARRHTQHQDFPDALAQPRRVVHRFVGRNRNLPSLCLSLTPQTWPAHSQLPLRKAYYATLPAVPANIATLLPRAFLPSHTLG